MSRYRITLVFDAEFPDAITAFTTGVLYGQAVERTEQDVLVQGVMLSEHPDPDEHAAAKAIIEEFGI